MNKLCPYCGVLTEITTESVGFDLLKLDCKDDPSHRCIFTYTYLNEAEPFTHMLVITDGYTIISSRYPAITTFTTSVDPETQEEVTTQHDWRTSITLNGETTYQDEMLTEDEIKVIVGK